MYNFLKGGGREMKNIDVAGKKELVEKLKSFGIEEGSLVATLTTDLDRPYSYGRTTLCALKDALCVRVKTICYTMKSSANL